MSAVFAFDPERPRSKHFASMTKKKRAERFFWDLSLATAVLEVAGCVETSNEKLLDIRKRHQYSSEASNKPRVERPHDDWTTIKTNSKLVAGKILRCADIVFTTCVNVA